jgi:hypothetical protein
VAWSEPRAVNEASEFGEFGASCISRLTPALRRAEGHGNSSRKMDVTLWPENRSRALYGAIALCLVTSCGARSNDGEDGTSMRCQGDLVGDWAVVELREFTIPWSSDGQIARCGGEVLRPVDTIDVTLAFESNGTYSFSGDYEGRMVYVLPPDCLLAAWVDSVPETLTEDFCADVVAEDMEECNLDGEACVCSRRRRNELAGYGTYSVDGNTLRQTPGSNGHSDLLISTLDELVFCVEGDQLKVDSWLAGFHHGGFTGVRKH